MKTYRVIAQSQKNERVWIWNSKDPLPLGHPAQWILEENHAGIHLKEVPVPLRKLYVSKKALLKKAKPIQSWDPAHHPRLQYAMDDFSLRIHPIFPGRSFENDSSSDALAQVSPQLLQSPKDPDTEKFNRSLFASIASVLGVILVIRFIAVFWTPASLVQNSKDLIPPQFAKIVLTPKKSQSSSARSMASMPSSTQRMSAEKVAKVTQAFRSKALQSSINGLLQGGMTLLLAQSESLAGHSKSASNVKRVFETRDESLRAGAPQVGDALLKTSQVAALGGEGSYGKGQGVQVAGQGRSHISLNSIESQVEEGLTKDEVGEVIHRHMSEIRYCYESALLKSTDVEGRLLINFTISGLGKVNQAFVKESSVPDSRLNDCIIRRLVTWKFPNTKGGVEVAVSYPFIFKTLGR